MRNYTIVDMRRGDIFDGSWHATVEVNGEQLHEMHETTRDAVQKGLDTILKRFGKMMTRAMRKSLRK